MPLHFHWAVLRPNGFVFCKFLNLLHMGKLGQGEKGGSSSLVQGFCGCVNHQHLRQPEIPSSSCGGRKVRQLCRGDHDGLRKPLGLSLPTQDDVVDLHCVPQSLLSIFGFSFKASEECLC